MDVDSAERNGRSFSGRDTIATCFWCSRSLGWTSLRSPPPRDDTGLAGREDEDLFDDLEEEVLGADDLDDRLPDVDAVSTEAELELECECALSRSLRGTSTLRGGRSCERRLRLLCELWDSELGLVGALLVRDLCESLDVSVLAESRL